MPGVRLRAMPHRRHPVVKVLVAGAGLSVAAACHKDVPAAGPPEPLPTDQKPVPIVAPPTSPPIMTSNPPAPDVPVPSSALPTWDDVESGHPKGATNPPLPLLVVSADGAHCWKEWVSPMRPPAEVLEAVQSGGRVLADGETSSGTEIQCPDEATGLLGGGGAGEL